jgi:hypothetical protein
MKDGIRNLVDLLKVNVIPNAQSSRLYDVGSVPERFTKQTEQGKGKHGFRMVIYGI